MRNSTTAYSSFTSDLLKRSLLAESCNTMKADTIFRMYFYGLHTLLLSRERYCTLAVSRALTSYANISILFFFFPQIVLVHGASLNLQQTWGVRRQLLLTENFCSDKQLRSSKHKLRNSPQQGGKSPEHWPSGWGWCCPNAARSAYIRILQLHHPDYSSFLGFSFFSGV